LPALPPTDSLKVPRYRFWDAGTLNNILGECAL
jgi:hypothetical protein